MKRIILHWTAGGPKASVLDREHYHFMVEQDGVIVKGRFPVSANAAPIKGEYAAHTRNCNSDSIGVALCGMLGAVENPFDAGKHPINKVQWAAAAKLCAALCKQYSIKPSATTLLSHAEVQGTLGIAQRGKWDIARLPWAPDIKGANLCGDMFRGNVWALMNPVPVMQPAAVMASVETNDEDDKLLPPLDIKPEAYKPVAFADFAKLSPIVENVLELVPSAAGLVFGSAGEKTASKIIDIVGSLTGLTEPKEIREALNDPAMQEKLKAALERDLALLKLDAEDRGSARNQTIELVKAGSPIAYGAVVVSTIIVVGFFAVLIAVLTRAVPQDHTVSMMLGTLVAGFGAVVNYWLGSSNGSNQKNATINNMLKKG